MSTQRVGDGLREDRGEVEQAEHDANRYGGVADDGGHAEAEEGDEGELEDAADGGARRLGAARHTNLWSAAEGW